MQRYEFRPGPLSWADAAALTELSRDVDEIAHAEPTPPLLRSGYNLYLDTLGPNDLSPNIFTTNVAKIFLGVVGALSGLGTFGAYTLQDGDVVIAGTANNDPSFGVYVAHSGAWTQPSWYQTGMVFDGPVYVWVTEYVNGSVAYPVEFALIPEYGVTGSPPYAWTVGTTAITGSSVTPVSFVGAGTGVTVTTTVSPYNFFLFTVNATGTFADITLPNSGSPPSNPPSGDITLYQTGGSLFTIDSSGTIVAIGGGPLLDYLDSTGTTTATYATVFNIHGSKGIHGNFSINVTTGGGVAIDVRVTWTDAYGNVATYVQTAWTAGSHPLHFTVEDAPSTITAGHVYLPIVNVQMEVQDDLAGTHANFEYIYSLIH